MLPVQEYSSPDSLPPSSTKMDSVVLSGVIPDVKQLGVSIVTPSGVTQVILQEGYNVGIRWFFLQPGTYDKETDVLIKTQLSDANIVKGCVLIKLNK